MSKLIAFFFWPAAHLGHSCKENVSRRVEGGLAGVLNDTDNEADADYLHGQIIGNPKEAAGDRNEQERTASYAGSPASRNCRYDTENESRSKVNPDTQLVDSSQGQGVDSDGGPCHIDSSA